MLKLPSKFYGDNCHWPKFVAVCSSGSTSFAHCLQFFTTLQSMLLKKINLIIF